MLISFKTIRHKKFFIATIKLYQSQLTEQSYFGMVGHNWSIFKHGQIKSLIDAINNLVEAKTFGYRNSLLASNKHYI